MKARLDAIFSAIETDAAMFERHHRKDKETIIRALLAAEDHRAAQHRGIDYYSLARAILRSFSSGRVRGLSTIEQQYVRLIERRKGNLLLCKIRELYWSRMLCRRVSKEQIWCGYLWRAYYGANMIGYTSTRYLHCSKSESLGPQAAAKIVAYLKFPRPKVLSNAWQEKHSRRVAYTLRRQGFPS